MTNILIIDEISMMSVKLLEILDTIGKQIRKNNKPFGGIQLLFSGDFYQLPPVGDNTDAATKQFCFESEIWNTLFHYEINLIPLILSWAITIHKAQGTTLELAEIDIGSGVFECGQSYVALSRVKDIYGLYLTAFNPNNIKVNTKVIEYYNKLNN